MPRTSWILLAGLLVAGSACARKGAAGPEAGAPQASDSVTLVVINHAAVPMNLFARGASQSYRVGTVEPGVSSRFVLRLTWLWGGTTEFVAEPRGLPASGFRSGPFNLRPGDVVDFEMTTASSSATLRPFRR